MLVIKGSWKEVLAKTLVPTLEGRTKGLTRLYATKRLIKSRNRLDQTAG